MAFPSPTRLVNVDDYLNTSELPDEWRSIIQGSEDLKGIKDTGSKIVLHSESPYIPFVKFFDKLAEAKENMVNTVAGEPIWLIYGTYEKLLGRATEMPDALSLKDEGWGTMTLSLLTGEASVVTDNVPKALQDNAVAIAAAKGLNVATAIVHPESVFLNALKTAITKRDYFLVISASPFAAAPKIEKERLALWRFPSQGANELTSVPFATISQTFRSQFPSSE